MTEEDKNKDTQNPADEWEQALDEQAAEENQAVENDGDLQATAPAEDDWAAAMAEQEQAEEPAAEPDTAAEDDWAAAMQEQADAAPSEAEQETTAADDWSAALQEQSSETETAVADKVFKPLDSESTQANSGRDLDMVMEIPVTLSVQLGETRLTIRELLDLAKGSVVELDGLAGEPMDILINGYLIAQGEVVVVDDKYGIRITDILTPADRIHKINKR